MWRFVIGFTVIYWLGACNQLFNIPDVTLAGDKNDAPGHDTGPPPEFLSCVGLPMTCGASGGDSCCTSFDVQGGSYYRSYDLTGDAYSGSMIYPATVSSFRFDKYEVTVERFRAFVNAGMGTQLNPPPPGAGAHPNIAGSGWDSRFNFYLLANTADLIAAVKCDLRYQTWTDVPGANEHRPMSCITWYEAMAFCIWDGGYLPTVAEWNYAATGGDQQRAYPWSSLAGPLTIDGFHASYDDGGNCVGDGLPGCAVTDLVEVGTKPAGDGRWGQSDLAGNASEWILDWEPGGYLNPCTDCSDVDPNLAFGSGYGRAFRGGSFFDSATGLRTASRFGAGPTDRFAFIGARCARGAP